jgi:hypothetical protein
LRLFAEDVVGMHSDAHLALASLSARNGRGAGIDMTMTVQTDERSVDGAPEVLRHREKFLESLCDEGVRHGFIKR